MKQEWLILVILISLAGISGCVSAQLIKKNPEQTDSGRLLDYNLEQGLLKLNYERLYCEMEFINNGALRVRAAYSNSLPGKHDYAVVNRQRITTSQAAKSDKTGLLHFQYGNTEVRIFPQSFQAEVCQQGTNMYTFAVFRDTEKERLTVKSLYRNERFFGLGEKTGDFELTGRSFKMYNSDTYKYGMKTDPIYVSIPFYIAVASGFQYGVFFDSPARSSFNLSEDNYSYEVEDRGVDFTVFQGDMKSIITQYTALTGKPFLPPLWALGFHQSRYSYTNQEQVLSVARSFREQNLPLDVIYLDIGYMENHKSFTYNTATFSNPKKMNEELRKIGVRTVAIVDPGIKVDKNYPVYTSGLEKDVFVKQRTRKGKIIDYRGTVWPGVCNFPDFTKPETTAWWGEQYKVLTDLGIAGFWNDMNEPSVFSGPGVTMIPDAIQDNHGQPTEHRYLHNIYGMTMIEATRAGVQKILGNNRVFLLTRAGYAGMQRTAFVWTGDNTANWDHLRMNLSMTLNLGLSGVPYSGADIGGYTASPSSELFTRWIQMGTFIPFMRDHTEQGTKFQEPYTFDENLPAIRKYMKIRYRLLPYLYTEVYKTHQSGLPIVKPLFLEYGNEYLDVQQEFLFGDSLLVAPVLDKMKKLSELEITLPAGMWYDYHKGVPVSAGKQTWKVTMEDIPVFVRGGSILPSYEQNLLSTSDIKNNSDISLTVYPDKDGYATGSLYEDDGETLDFTKGVFALTAITCKISGTSAQVQIDTQGNYHPKRKLSLILPEGVTTAVVNGKTHTVKERKVEL